jgi:hypothetical protein
MNGSGWTVEWGSEIRPVEVDWLWPGYLARGKLAVLEGDPGMGKSLLTIDLMARLSRGGPFPNGAPLQEARTSILLSAEDDLADTVRPRAEAAGADLDRLLFPRFPDQLPLLPDEIEDLEFLMLKHRPALAVLDPLVAFLPPHLAVSNDQCMRLALTPLASSSAHFRCAVLAVRHLTKNPRDRAIYQGQGSLGIVAAARTALFVGPHPTDPDQRVLAVSKSNVGAQPPALGYRIVGTPAGPKIEWTGPVDVTADGLCERRKRLAALRPRERAVDWLRRELAAGPRPAADVYAAVAAAGIPERTLERAKKELGAPSHRATVAAGRGEWYWYDPDAAWPAGAAFAKPAGGAA